MAYSTITNWTATEWSEGLEAIARDTFVPLIMSVGASRVQMIRTSDLTFTVVTEYSDEGTANAGQAKIAEIRAKAAAELPMSMDNTMAGAVFANG
jgi:hypothetical protein